MSEKKLPYWLKGGIIGVIFAILTIIISNFSRSGRLLLFPIVYILSLIENNPAMVLLIIPLSIVFYLVLGIIIGLIVGKIRGKK